MHALVMGEDQQPRCGWVELAPEFNAYHDHEWGFPVVDDITLFEKLCLESFQSGLSWRTIYNKRPRFREAFCGFDFRRVSEFDAAEVERLMADPGIVRNRAKIQAVINNAQRTCELVGEAGSLAAFLWRYEPAAAPPVPPLRSTSPESVALSRELRGRGFKFLGPTTVYAFMQAMGLVNDHARGCFVRAQVARARSRMPRL